jgi:hypothetical protein
MSESGHRDRASYTKLETRQKGDVTAFFELKVDELETAELTIRRSAGIYIVELRPTDEPSTS